VFSFILYLIGSVRIAPKRILILGNRSDACNASVRTRGTAANQVTFGVRVR